MLLRIILFLTYGTFFSNYCFALLKSNDLFVEGGFSGYYLLEDFYTGGNGKVTFTLPVYSVDKQFDLIAGGSGKIERTSYLTQSNIYGVTSDITSYQLGLVSGIKYRVISPFYIYLLGNAYYSPYTHFENHFYLYYFDSYQSVKVDYNMNAGLELKFIYKLFRDFGVGLSVYGSYGYIKFNDSSFLSIVYQGKQGGYLIFNSNINFVYFIR
ncbi:hypothetical protein [Pigmentibacter ruber]|uniref:hypothetical protein n=1 Tax=Pigmentibacter ruber TaxID=2683196 RepID=UPI00131B4A77|nr:hypothetical protein [Pigmentibacter ruber]BFD32013.1 hypothetical protein GTC16762_16310 [Pigmentibacter ruber]